MKKRVNHMFSSGLSRRIYQKNIPEKKKKEKPAQQLGIQGMILSNPGKYDNDCDVISLIV